MLKLLIVDDEVNTRKGIIGRLPLIKMGITEVCEADDGVNGLKAVSSFVPDIVLTDVKMPRMDGVEMVFKIRELFPSCKVIFMSGYSDKEYLKSAIELKALNYIEKPINMNELKSALQVSISLCMEEINKKKAESEINNLLSASLSLVRNELALQLVSRNLNENAIVSSIKAACLDIPQDSIFVTVLLHIHNVSNSSVLQDYSFKQTFNEILENIKKQTRLSGLWAAKSDACIIIHLFGGPGENHLFSNERLDNAYRIVLDELAPSYPVSLASGKKVNGIYHIFESYESAVLGMQKSFYYGYNCIIKYCDDNKRPYKFSTQTIKDFSEFIRNEEHKKAEFLIRSTTSDIKRFDTTPVNQCKDFYYKLFLELTRASLQYGFSLMDEFESDTHLWQRFLSFATLMEMEDFIIGQISLYFEKLADSKLKDGVVINIIKYISKHYHEESMTISSISENTHLSPAYLSCLFKKSTGQTLIKYINSYRIEKSKELLQDKKLKISDIAIRVGFGDSNYFTKIFRKACGQTPSEYRERNI